ncbi:MAG: malate synthase A [Parcubacteria group bacterium]|nr:malate synthase A [Parcubacteria group bacterium]
MTSLPNGAAILGPMEDGFTDILNPEALNFLKKLHREFEPRRRNLLQKRKERQKEINSGKLPDFLSSTQKIRESDWQVAPIPADLMDRRVEITGPTDRKMIINGLNSGANVYMADYEDANSPTWRNMVQGQINLKDAVTGNISFTSPEGKRYQLAEKTATLMMRPRGWHMEERHLTIDGQPISALLFDFGLFFFHNARKLIEKGTSPYCYLPKMESHLEARLANDVFCMSQDLLTIPRGAIRATVLLETILAAFEMDEILYELRNHSAGLNFGRWDFIFSFIKKFIKYPQFVLPDRGQVTMWTHFLRSASLLLIKTCHKRGIHGMGGMAAQIPIKDNPQLNAEALAKVTADKEREVSDGHDGTWVAHPGLAPLAKAVFDAKMPTSHQIYNTKSDVQISAKDLLEVPKGEITERGLRANTDIGIQYTESWLRGAGCVPLYNLMEDSATAEISRAQVAQWIRHPNGVLADGRKVTIKLCRQIIAEEMNKIQSAVGDKRFYEGKYGLASQLFDKLITSQKFPEFMTTSAYDYL